jgi:hypothetical protein
MPRGPTGIACPEHQAVTGKDMNKRANLSQVWCDPMMIA